MTLLFHPLKIIPSWRSAVEVTNASPFQWAFWRPLSEVPVLLAYLDAWYVLIFSTCIIILLEPNSNLTENTKQPVLETPWWTGYLAYFQRQGRRWFVSEDKKMKVMKKRKNCNWSWTALECIISADRSYLLPFRIISTYGHYHILWSWALSLLYCVNKYLCVFYCLSLLLEGG